MESNYRFSINGYKVNPIYDAGLSKEYQTEGNEIFLRALITGKIKLNNLDFEWLKGQTIQTEFVVLVEMYLVDTWVEYWTGSFFKTDCNFDDDNKIVELKFQFKDQYTKILAGMDKEFDLMKLAPARTKLDIVKRPLIQLYVPGDSVVSCFLAGNYWEQDVLTEVISKDELKNKYYFALASTVKTFNISGDGEFAEFIGDYSNKGVGIWIEKNGVYKITENLHSVLIEIPGNEERNYYARLYYYKIVRIADNVTMWTSNDVRSKIVNGNGVKLINDYIGFQKNVGLGILTGFNFELEIYMRYLLDVETFLDLPTYLLPTDDFVSNNRNYKRAINYSFDLVSISLETQTEPTEWGLADDGKYFKPPTGNGKFYPVARSTWGFSSKWLNFSGINPAFEEKAQKAYTMKDGSMIADVIKVLLAQIDPDITHEGTPEFSQFLYGEINPISANFFRIMITQKSNVLSGEYDRPAQKALISLNLIFKMLKNTFKVYWYVDGNKLKFEHISFFRNGRSYTEKPGLNVDLTKLLDHRNKKPYGYNTTKYNYNKESLPEQIVFSWMDDVTAGFIGKPIVINSRFVQLGKVDDIQIEKFTSDIDYMLINPAACSPDGFALFAAVWDEITERYKLPFISKNIDGAQLKLQNGYVSVIYLQPTFWVYDLPSYDVKINGEPGAVRGITRTKTQSVKYPSIEDPDPLKLVKTYIGNGQINKLSINLSSRQNQIELLYDTE